MFTALHSIQQILVYKNGKCQKVRKISEFVSQTFHKYHKKSLIFSNLKTASFLLLSNG